MSTLRRVRQSHVTAPLDTGIPVQSANTITSGTPRINPSGISSAETFGTILFGANLTRLITAIPSAESFGAVTVRKHPGLLRFLIATDNA